MFGFSLFKKTESDGKSQAGTRSELSQRGRIIKPRRPKRKAGGMLADDRSALSFSSDYGHYERVSLYRFLREQIPIVNGAIWTWTRLCSSPMEFNPQSNKSDSDTAAVNDIVELLNQRLAPNAYYKSGGIDRLSDLFFSSLFTDGAFAGYIEYDQNGVIGFNPVDVRSLSFESEGRDTIICLETPEGKRRLDPAEFIYIPLDDDSTDPRGKSILQSIGFVSRIEQKLLDDMRKTMEKAGYNRVQVLVKKPERGPGESEGDYIERANSYFDDTVGLFSGIKPSDSVVTWDDIELKVVSPAGGGSSVTHSWYLSHRAVVEDVCAGVHLDPFMLGYSYGNTQSWAKFKYELVLRQVISVQKLALRFFEWLVNTHLKLQGSELRAAARFDNDKINGALERYKSRYEEAKRLRELYESGLLTREEVRGRLLRLEED